MIDNYMTTMEISEHLGIHYETAKRLCRENKIPAHKVYNSRLVDKDELLKFAETYKYTRSKNGI